MLEWADTEETVEKLRRKTAEHFHGNINLSHYNTSLCMLHHNKFLIRSLFPFPSVAPKKRKQAEVLEGILGTMETTEAEED